MEQRINYAEKGGSAIKALYTVGGYLMKSKLGQHLLELIYYRVSQMNGCGYCLDMHSKDLLAKGESQQRLFVLDAWREAPFYTQRERVALAWAEAVTKNVIPDSLFEETRKEFSEEELIDLTLATTNVNTWNRLNQAFRPMVGSYQVGQWI